MCAKLFYWNKCTLGAYNIVLFLHSKSCYKVDTNKNLKFQFRDFGFVYLLCYVRFDSSDAMWSLHYDSYFDLLLFELLSSRSLIVYIHFGCVKVFLCCVLNEALHGERHQGNWLALNASGLYFSLLSCLFVSFSEILS